MQKKNALILLIFLSALYIYVIWIANYFGPGATLFFSVLFVIAVIFLMGVLFEKKKK